MSIFKKILPALLLSLILVVAGCGGGTSEEGGQDTGDNQKKTEEKGPIKIGLNNWAENIAVSNMWKILLEEQGYDVKLTRVQKAALYAGLESEDLDVGLEIWLPHTDKKYYEDFKDKLDWRQDWFKGTALGLVVPEYVEDVNTIADLKKNKDLFDPKEIYGIDAGSSLMGLTDKVMPEYGLADAGWKLLPSSGPVMTAQLRKSYDDKEPVVVTLWKPHWAFAKYKLKFLEDPKKIYGEEENISYATRKGFVDDYPKVTKWLDTWMMDDNSLGSLMASINEADDPAAGAKAWIEENRDLVNEWMQKSE